MTFKLEDLWSRPDLWHPFLAAGTVDWSQTFVTVSDEAVNHARANGLTLPAPVLRPEPATTGPAMIPPAVPPPMPVPLGIRLLLKLARPGDRGLGDIIERKLGGFGSAYKKWHRWTFGQECGCETRREYWNLRYPVNAVTDE